MCRSHILWTGQLNVYFHIKRKVSEVDHVNGMNFLFKRYDSVLGDIIPWMEFGNFFIRRLLICSQTYLPS
jgi:hypothetical protein